MEVILTADVKALGEKGDKVKVSDGYAKNFLLPKKLAVEASNANLNNLKGKNEAAEHKRQQELENARNLKEIIEKKPVSIKEKSGENGRLFGSVTSKEISEAVKIAFGVDVDKKKIVLKEPIKNFGTYNIDVKLCAGVSAKITVSVTE